MLQYRSNDAAQTPLSSKDAHSVSKSLWGTGIMMTLRENQTRLTRCVLLCDLYLTLYPFKVSKS